MTTKQIFEIDDLIVILLGSPTRSQSLRNRLNGVTRLEKLIFLLETETELPKVLTESPEYEPYNYGPFSKKVYESLDMLAAAGLLKVSGSGASEGDALEASEILGSMDSSDEPYAERQFELTPLGRKYYEAVAEELPEWVVPQVSKFKDSFGMLSLRQLVRYVYENHPDMITKSLIRDQVLD